MNAEDTLDIRPGRAAARELKILSPLHELGFTKQNVRDAGRALGLPNWDKPAAACLASRVPYGTSVTPKLLSQIERAKLRSLSSASANCACVITAMSPAWRSPRPI